MNDLTTLTGEALNVVVGGYRDPSLMQATLTGLGDFGAADRLGTNKWVLKPTVVEDGTPYYFMGPDIPSWRGGDPTLPDMAPAAWVDAHRVNP